MAKHSGSAALGTLCPCGNEAKLRDQLFGRRCFNRLPVDLKSLVSAASRKTAEPAERSYARCQAMEFLKENQ